MGIRLLFILIFFVLVTIESIAQCAMCKAVVEANLESGGTKGAGLNDGILFLMSMPYLAFFLFCIMFTIE